MVNVTPGPTFPVCAASSAGMRCSSSTERCSEANVVNVMALEITSLVDQAAGGGLRAAVGVRQLSYAGMRRMAEPRRRLVRSRR
jgi:hypothetical protein